MDMFYTPEKDTVFETLFGRTMIAWNSAEGEVRQLLVFLAGDQGRVEGLGPHIVVAEMGTRHLSETLRAFADACFDEPEQSAIKHVAVLYDNLVAYRNHYIHGIQHLYKNIGHIGSFSAKSSFKVVSGDVSVEEMGAFLDKVGELFDYVIGVQAYLNDHEGGQDTLPDKPPQLPQLVKQTTSLPKRLPQPQPSRG